MVQDNAALGCIEARESVPCMWKYTDEKENVHECRQARGRCARGLEIPDPKL